MEINLGTEFFDIARGAAQILHKGFDSNCPEEIICCILNAVLEYLCDEHKLTQRRLEVAIMVNQIGVEEWPEGPAAERLKTLMKESDSERLVAKRIDDLRGRMLKAMIL